MFSIDDNIENFRRSQNVNRGRQNRNNVNSGIRNRNNVSSGLRNTNDFNIGNRDRNTQKQGRRFDRQNIGNHNFGGLRRETPFQGNIVNPKRHNINNEISKRIIETPIIHERDLTMAYYNPYLYLHPFYDDAGNLVIYNSVNSLDNFCKSKCLTECAGKDLNCLKNCYDLCSFDENRGLDGDSLNYKESFISKTKINEILKKNFLIIIVIIIIIIYCKTQK
jgi:hypothetical protein